MRGAWFACFFIVVIILAIHNLGAKGQDVGKAILVASGLGSSAFTPIMNAWSAGYTFAYDALKLPYESLDEADGVVDQLLATNSSTLYGFLDFLDLDYAASTKAFGSLLFLSYGVVLPYRVDGLPEGTSLVLSTTILAGIYTNEIMNWNDSQIQELNANITMPDLPIRPLIYNQSAAATSPLSQGLSQAASSWNTSVTPPIGSYVEFDALIGEARAIYTDADVSTLYQLISSTNGAIGYAVGAHVTQLLSSSSAAISTVLPLAQLQRGNNTVTHSAATVQAALGSFERQIIASTGVSQSIVNPADQSAWPLCSTGAVAIPRASIINYCEATNAMVAFFQWSNLNDGAISIAKQLGYGQLTTALLSRLRTQGSSDFCSGAKIQPTVVSSGESAAAPIIRGLARVAPDSLGPVVTVTYAFSGRQTARQSFFLEEVDFGTDIETYSYGDYMAYPDILQIPAYAQGIAIAVNIPNIDDNSALVLTPQVLAGIYTGTITRWNHPEIISINGNLVDKLPAEPIMVVTRSDDSAETLIFTQTLTQMVSGFPITPDVTVSFDGIPSSNVISTASTEIITAINSTLWTIGYLSYPTLVQAQTVGIAPTLAVARTTNSQNKIVGPFTVNIASAITDFRMQRYDPSTNTYSDAKVAHAFHQALSNYTQNNTTVSNVNNKRASTDPDSLSLVGNLINGAGVNSYPFANYAYFSLRTRAHEQACYSYIAVLDFLFWQLSDTTPDKATNASGAAAIPGNIAAMALEALATLKCNGTIALKNAACLQNGQVCSDVGTCSNGACLCPLGYSGKYCGNGGDGSDNTTIYVAVFASVIPACILCCLLILIAAILLIVFSQRSSRPWAVDFSEIELKQQIGAGGFGAVHKAIWKDTDVAVKLIAGPGDLTREMKRNFISEVRIMTQLRHPNVVLFMGACTTPPNLCIIMEFMELGSLYDVLHNELVPKLPMSLKIKLALQSAQGMHFLHSSGILHRDLKSPNILLDDKWNAKISDFGLTKFKQDRESTSEIDGFGGSLLWTAPEILGEESPFAEPADVYSFGIVLWELLTSEEPYHGLNPTTVAVCVLRDDLRPKIPENNSASPDYIELMQNCWDKDTSARPTFLEAVTRLKAMQSSTSTGGTGSDEQVSKPTLGSPFDTANSLSSSDSHHLGNEGKLKAIDKAIVAPKGEMVIGFTDIAKASVLWEFCPEAMRDATVLHNAIIRQALIDFRGYEVTLLREGNMTTGVGSFCVAFQDVKDALQWAIAVQTRLLAADWNPQLLSHPAAAEEWGGQEDQTLFRGLRVRMGMSLGTPRPVRDPMTRRIEYLGPVVNIAGKVTSAAHGGQILVTRPIRKAVKHMPSNEGFAFSSVGKVDVAGEKGLNIYELKTSGLEGRFFGGVSMKRLDGSNSSLSLNKDKNPLAFKSLSRSIVHSSDDSFEDSGEGIEMHELNDDGVGTDRFLTSANLCRWIIDFKHIDMGKQIGQGSYGMVYKARWKGVDVAVKRLTKQKLNERDMLDFRAEVAFLSEMHHPHIVLFIGACMRKPNLCIVTEHVKQGSLQDVLRNKSIKLAWQMRMKIARGAALGIFYLHSLDPVILHRDLKSSNILIDENWNAKVADFGFARIRQDNATMTRCGSPCWTAPEVIQGKKYTEKADVYSFGIILWEILTRQQPYKGQNYMNVSMEVVAGSRPKLPGNTPKDFAQLITRCWREDFEKRPAMQKVVKFFDSEDTNTDGSPSVQTTSSGEA